jgi:hypothetical protein
MKKNTASQRAYFTIYDNDAESYVTSDLSAQCSAVLLKDGTAAAGAGAFSQVSGKHFQYAFTTAETNYNQILLDISCSGGNYRIDSQTFETDDFTTLLAQLLTTTTPDGMRVDYILELVAAMVNGKFAVDTPSAGNITFYKRNSTDVLTVVNVNSTTRTRIS